MHEQAHWLLMQRHKGQAREMLPELIRMIPNIRNQAASRRQQSATSYIRLVVLMLEWQALKDLIGVRPRACNGIQVAASL
jgi:hypothetical protein